MRSLARTSVLALLLLPVPLVAKGLLVSPSQLFVDADENGEWTLVLKPTTAEPTRVVIGVRTFLIDEGGRPLLDARDPDNPLGRRTRTDLVTVEPALVLLEGEPATVKVRLRAPPGAGSAWAAIVLDVEPVEAASGRGAPVDVVTRVVVPVVVTRGTSEPPVLALESVRARVEPGGIEVTALVRNEGPAVVRTFAEVTVEESGGPSRLEIAHGRVPNLVLFPGLARLVRAHLVVAPSPREDRLVRVVVPAGTRFFEAEVRPEPFVTRDQGAGSSADPGTKTESPD